MVKITKGIYTPALSSFPYTTTHSLHLPISLHLYTLLISLHTPSILPLHTLPPPHHYTHTPSTTPKHTHSLHYTPPHALPSSHHYTHTPYISLHLYNMKSNIKPFRKLFGDNVLIGREEFVKRNRGSKQQMRSVHKLKCTLPYMGFNTTHVLVDILFKLTSCKHLTCYTPHSSLTDHTHLPSHLFHKKK